MIKEAIEYVVGLRQPKAEVVNGRALVIRDGGIDHLESPASMAKALEFHSLSGLVGYVASKHDDVPDNTALVVDGPEGVRLIGELTREFRQREVLAEAVPYLSPGFLFGQYLDTERFIVALQTCFEPGLAVDGILKVVGNIVAENVANVSDDGVTQQVTARAGIARKTDVAVPNPVVLNPYRTFPEVAQPPSRYVLRLRRGSEGELPTAALFEVQDNRWKHDAVASIELHLAALLDKAGVQIPVFA